MKILIILTLCIYAIHIQASHSDEDPSHGAGVLSLTHSPSQAVHLDMDQFAASLGQTSIDHAPLTGPLSSSSTAATLLTQIAHGTTSTAPTFLTKHIRDELTKIETEDPLKFQRIIGELTQHRTRALHIARSPNNISGGTATVAPTDLAAHDPASLGAALQNGVPASAVQLITAAASANNAQQLSVNDAQAVTNTELKAKFWTVLIVGATTSLGALAVAIIQALGVHV